MAHFKRVLTFTANTSNGNQSVTGAGGQPKIVRFYTSFATTLNTEAEHSLNSTGVAISSTKRFCTYGTQRYNQGTAVSRAGRFNNRCIALEQANNAVAHADFVSMDADGFTINWINAPTTAVLIVAIVEGGDDIENVDLVNFITRTSSFGPDDFITGIAFQPNYAEFIGNIRTTAVAAVSTDSTGNHMRYARGWAYNNGATIEQVGMQVQYHNGSGEEQQETTMYPNRIGGYDDGAARIPSYEVTAFNADGLTLTKRANQFGTTARWHVLLVRYSAAVTVSVAAYDAPATTGNRAYTTPGFEPSFVEILHPNAQATFTADNTEDTDGTKVDGLSHGWYDGTTGRALANHANHAAGTTQYEHAVWGRIVQSQQARINPQLGGGTVYWQANVATLDATGFTLNYTTVATATKFLAVAVKKVAVATNTALDARSTTRSERARATSAARDARATTRAEAAVATPTAADARSSTRAEATSATATPTDARTTTRAEAATITTWTAADARSTTRAEATSATATPTDARSSTRAEATTATATSTDARATTRAEAATITTWSATDARSTTRAEDAVAAGINLAADARSSTRIEQALTTAAPRDSNSPTRAEAATATATPTDARSATRSEDAAEVGSATPTDARSAARAEAATITTWSATDARSTTRSEAATVTDTGTALDARSAARAEAATVTATPTDARSTTRAETADAATATPALDARAAVRAEAATITLWVATDARSAVRAEPGITGALGVILRPGGRDPLSTTRSARNPTASSRSARTP